MSHKCRDCVRFTIKDGEYYCSMSGHSVIDYPDNELCHDYWDKEKKEREDYIRQQRAEEETRKLWAIYSKRPPIKLPIESDGYGVVPVCPSCGEVPYDMEQCQFCGQHFLPQS